MKKSAKENYLSISQFSKISEISRKALIFYDNIGLFCPEFTDDNGYRYYSHEQIYVISAILILKELGMSLSEIKDYMDKRDISSAVALLNAQNKVINEKIRELKNTQDMLLMKLEGLSDSKQVVFYEPHIVVQSPEPLYISQPFDFEKDKIPDETWADYYMECKMRGITIGYPEGYLVKKENLLRGQSSRANHLLSYVMKKKLANGAAPQGHYLMVYGKGDLEDTEKIYETLFAYIRENHLQMIGDAYEKRLVDEIATEEKEKQVVQVKIQIAEP